VARSRKAKPELSVGWRHDAIDAVVEGRATSLDLNTLDRFGELGALPDEVRRLTGLRSLSLGRSRITSLPEWLTELPDLELIDARDSRLRALPVLPKVQWALSAETLQFLEGRQIIPEQIFAIGITSKTWPEAVRYLVAAVNRGELHLSELDVTTAINVGADRAMSASGWRFLDVIDGALDILLAGQPDLMRLNLGGCPIGRVPAPLIDLAKLTDLNLAGVWPDQIPDWLFGLPELTTLNLSHNGLDDLPAAITDARRLTHLELAYSRFSRIPDGIWELSALEHLDLSYCPITQIPADILRLGRLQELWIYSPAQRMAPELAVPPPEVAEQGLEAIKSYWRQQQEVGMDFLAEAKLLIVGEAGAGKTTLAKKILNPSYLLDSQEASTEGIDVSTWEFPTGIRVQEPGGERILERQFRVNIWDFGGQEIYHATHQFFLTKRSVYVLVADERREDIDFEYWLEVINLLSDGSPVVVVQNQKQGRNQRIDLGTLRLRYPNLGPEVRLNLGDNSGLADAVGRIRRELEQLPHIGTPLPRTWRNVRVALEADPRNYIGADEFFDVCAANGFTRRDDMQQLGGYLHDLGVCLFFQDDDLLSRTIILKPEWGTGAVYRVLDDAEIAGQLGVFDRADLRRIWQEPSYEPMRAELLQLMVKFGLCYPLPGADAFVAPQLLSPNRPLYGWDETDNLVLRYEYDVMPKGIIWRLIVALHDLIQPDNSAWRSGVLLEYDASRADVIEDYGRRRLSIRVRGGDPRVLLGIIDHALAVIHRSYPAIRFDKFRPCDCARCAEATEPTMFSIRELKDFARTGDQIQCRVSRRLRDPVALLRGLFPQGDDLSLAGSGGQPVRIQPEVFVSYKWGGDAEELVDQVESRLSARGILVTRDKNEIKYRDSIEQFMRRLGAGKCVIVVLNDGYLRSEYCMFELTQIASRPEFAPRVFPIVLDAGIFDSLALIGYVKYWERKIKELDTAMRDVGQENLQGIRERLDLYATIRSTISRLMEVLGDMNALSPQVHRGTDFEELFRALDKALPRSVSDTAPPAGRTVPVKGAEAKHGSPAS
jgi:Leucine-rich repeat (LRR) protein